jgi:hypothetical protein
MLDRLNPQPAWPRHFTSKFSGSNALISPIIPVQRFGKPENRLSFRNFRLRVIRAQSPERTRGNHVRFANYMTARVQMDFASLRDERRCCVRTLSCFGSKS